MGVKLGSKQQSKLAPMASRRLFKASAIHSLTCYSSLLFKLRLRRAVYILKDRDNAFRERVCAF